MLKVRGRNTNHQREQQRYQRRTDSSLVMCTFFFSILLFAKSDEDKTKNAAAMDSYPFPSLSL